MHFAGFCTHCTRPTIVWPKREDTEHFYRVDGKFLIAALIFLAPAMTGDLLVVIRQVTGSLTLSTWIAALLPVGFYALWFGVSLWRVKARR